MLYVLVGVKSMQTWETDDWFADYLGGNRDLVV